MAYISAVLKVLSNDTLSDSNSMIAAKQILDFEKELAKARHYYTLLYTTA